MESVSKDTSNAELYQIRSKCVSLLPMLKLKKTHRTISHQLSNGSVLQKHRLDASVD